MILAAPYSNEIQGARGEVAVPRPSVAVFPPKASTIAIAAWHAEVLNRFEASDPGYDVQFFPPRSVRSRRGITRRNGSKGQDIVEGNKSQSGLTGSFHPALSHLAKKGDEISELATGSVSSPHFRP